MNIDVAINDWGEITIGQMRLRIEEKVSGAYVLSSLNGYPPENPFPVGE
jgi:hypothetical protein